MTKEQIEGLFFTYACQVHGSRVMGINAFEMAIRDATKQARKQALDDACKAAISQAKIKPESFNHEYTRSGYQSGVTNCVVAIEKLLNIAKKQ